MIAASVSLPTKGRVPLVPNVVIAMSVVVFTEVMFFAALVSAYVVIQAGATDWSPPSGVAWPLPATLLNTVALLLSGLCVVVASQHFFHRREQASTWFLGALLLGLGFVGFQGTEWLRLLSYGVSMHTGMASAMYFLLIGAHATHALAGVVVLSWAYYRLAHGRLSQGAMTGVLMYWLLVVGIWPVLYRMVYFS